MSRLPLLAATLASLSMLIASFAVDASRVAAGRDAQLAWQGAQAARAAPERHDGASSLPLPQLRIDYRADTGARLSGTVPDEAERSALLRRARALYGADRVQDALRIAPVGNPAWLSPAFVPDLRGADQASALLADARLEVEGTAPTDAARRQISGSVAAFGDYGLRVVNRLVVQGR